MTIKEKEKLSDLVAKIIEHTNILHPPAAEGLIGRLDKAEDKDVLDILVAHMPIWIPSIFMKFIIGLICRHPVKILVHCLLL